MKLYEVPNGTWINFRGNRLYFEKVDGMYGRCKTPTHSPYDLHEPTHTVHLVAWERVELADDQ